MYSDHELNLPSRSFTGEEWFNGTAQDFFRRQYWDAVSRLIKKQQDKRKNQASKGTALVSQADIDSGKVKPLCLPPVRLIQPPVDIV